MQRQGGNFSARFRGQSVVLRARANEHTRRSDCYGDEAWRGKAAASDCACGQARSRSRLRSSRRAETHHPRTVRSAGRARTCPSSLSTPWTHLDVSGRLWTYLRPACASAIGRHNTHEDVLSVIHDGRMRGSRGRLGMALSAALGQVSISHIPCQPRLPGRPAGRSIGQRNNCWRSGST